MYKPYLQNTPVSRDILTAFGGYENNLIIRESSFADTKNTSSRLYPMLSGRHRRAYFNLKGKGLSSLFSKTKVGYINNGTLYYGGEAFTGISFPELNEERRFVSMGARLIVFPDKVYINTADFSDYGYLEAEFKGNNSRVCLCNAQGKEYESYVLNSVSPEEPEEGDVWLDSSNRSLMQYSASFSMWMEIPETYIKISCPDIGKQFKEYDGVTLSGFGDKDIDSSHVIRYKTDDYIVITGIVDTAINVEGEIRVKREIPEMDFVCENSNRLWGCNSKRNEIYASALGDPCNFNVFTGISTDSYAASVGTDSEFTGAVSFRGFVLFFKEHCVHKVYGSNPPYTITTSFLRGVQKGSEKSLVQLNETLYYKSTNGICAYEGGVPVCVSENLGKVHYKNAVAGALNNKYYVCMCDSNNIYRLFSFDEEKRIWHKEDEICIKDFCTNNSNMYFLCEKDGESQIGIINGEEIYGNLTEDLKGFSLEDNVKWEAQTGLWGLQLPENKYYSSVTIRAVGEYASRLTVDFEYNSSGKWENEISKSFFATGSMNIPCISPRCDHLRIRFRGEGKVKLISVSVNVESGSELSV